MRAVIRCIALDDQVGREAVVGSSCHEGLFNNTLAAPASEKWPEIRSALRHKIHIRRHDYRAANYVDVNTRIFKQELSCGEFGNHSIDSPIRNILIKLFEDWQNEAVEASMHFGVKQPVK